MFRQDGLDLPVREHPGRGDRTLAPLAPRRVIALFRPRTRLSPRNARRLLSIEGETPNYSGCHSARDASKIPRYYVTPGVGHHRPVIAWL